MEERERSNDKCTKYSKEIRDVQGGKLRLKGLKDHKLPHLFAG